MENDGVGAFKFKGVDNTRIEALSDGVFAIAIALLLISTSIPEKFSELVAFIHDFVPFCITITLLMVIWYQHYLFFLRYGLKDGTTVALNTVLLILILYYVYPLKFLFKTLYLLFTGLFSGDQKQLEYLFTDILPRHEGNTLMVIYGIGAASIFLVLAVLYWYAYAKRRQLDLSRIECFDTKTSIIQNVLMASIPILSTCISFWELGGRDSFSVAGMFYMSYMIIMPAFGVINGKKRLRLIKELSVQD